MKENEGGVEGRRRRWCEEPLMRMVKGAMFKTLTAQDPSLWRSSLERGGMGGVERGVTLSLNRLPLNGTEG